jgi:biotin synthase-related radical SAM superfamily protein
MLVLKRAGKFITEVRHVPRPQYYNQKTSDGVDMMRIAPKRGQDCLVLNYATFCAYWGNNEGCRFCNIVPTMKWNKDDLQVNRRKSNQIMETAQAAFKEGVVNHILITGGMLPAYEGGDREDEMIAGVIGAMQEGIGKLDIPINVIRTAPKDEDLKSIEEQKDLGAFSVAYNLELWDPLMFKYYCPGKESVQGRDHWLKALEVATEVYGSGKVSTHFVAGLELMEHLLEGTEWCSKRGIGVIPLIFSPVKGAYMEGMRSPSADWFVKMTQKVADIRLKYGVDSFEPAALPNDCTKCCMPSLIGDELRLRKVERGEL